MVDAMVCEIALMRPEAADPRALRTHGRAMISRLLDGWRKL